MICWHKCQAGPAHGSKKDKKTVFHSSCFVSVLLLCVFLRVLVESCLARGTAEDVVLAFVNRVRRFLGDLEIGLHHWAKGFCTDSWLFVEAVLLVYFDGILSGIKAIATFRLEA